MLLKNLETNLEGSAEFKDYLQQQVEIYAELSVTNINSQIYYLLDIIICSFCNCFIPAGLQ